LPMSPRERKEILHSATADAAVVSYIFPSRPWSADSIGRWQSLVIASKKTSGTPLSLSAEWRRPKLLIRQLRMEAWSLHSR